MQTAPMENGPKTVLVLGADGFIGRHIAFGLRARGFRVIAHARTPERLAQMGFETLAADLSHRHISDPDFWRPRLAGVDHIVNLAGVLTAPDHIFHAVHVGAPDAIYQSLPKGCTGVLISAVGIDDAQTDFARFRRDGEAIAARHNITILRAGLVLADTSYGGSSLARALAALPLVTPVVGDGGQRFNPIHATDLCDLIIEALAAPPTDQMTTDPIEVGGLQTLSQTEMLQALRAWLGLKPTRIVHLPLAFARTLGRIGDAMRLGPISQTAVDQLNSGVHADTTTMLEHFRTTPRGFDQFQNARPAGTQDLWHARLYLLRPILRIVMGLLWLASGVLGLLLPPADYLPMIQTAALSDQTLITLARLGGVIDIGIALALFSGWRPKLMALAQLTMVLGYTLAFSLLAPALWLLPLGGLLKNLPILALIALMAVLEEER